MSLLALKLILTPFLIAAATLAARRWGYLVGGLLVGLPLTSGPISVFLALENGPAFAAQASHGALFGLIAIVAFCAAYARSAKKSRWPSSSTLALSVYLLVAWSLSLLTLNLVVLTVFVIVIVWLGIKAIGVPSSISSQVAAPPWDLPLRMTTATVMVLLITGGAEYLGPKWSGLLSLFPVFTSVMAVFSHQQGGAMAAQHLLRGIIIGCLSAASFFVVVGLTVENTSPVWVYVLATSIAVIVNGISLIALMQRSKFDVRVTPMT